MKAAAIDRFGAPSVIKLRTVTVPEPGPNEVLIEVHAAGLGIWDAKIREGEWAEKRTKFPLVLGTDGAGIVVAKGARVRRFEIGDRVYGYEYQSAIGGFFAEYVLASASHVAKIPRRLDFVHAGALPVTGLTALQGIDDHLGVRKGETVLVVGASGAVGTLAVQFARRHGARVIGTASGKDATTLVKRLGADAVIDARKKDAAERLRAAAPKGIDAALVLAGAPTLEAMLDLVRPGGRIAYPNGPEPEPKRRRKVRVESYNAEAGPKEYEKLERAVGEARLQVPVAGVYPLAQAARSHARIEKGHVLGRIAVQVRR
jgi:NADPH:quinone reductase-like Zn-dependent oxidoreductase